MAKSTRICKVCGKEYEYCKTWLNTDKFRYQDVACSKECGMKYFALIEASRSNTNTTPKVEAKKDVEVKEDAPINPKKKSQQKASKPKSEIEK